MQKYFQNFFLNHKWTLIIEYKNSYQSAYIWYLNTDIESIDILVFANINQRIKNELYYIMCMLNSTANKVIINSWLIIKELWYIEIFSRKLIWKCIYASALLRMHTYTHIYVQQISNKKLKFIIHLTITIKTFYISYYFKSVFKLYTYVLYITFIIIILIT